MVKVIIDLLNVNDFYGQSNDIDIAKGRYKYPTTWKELKQLLKRILKRKK